MSTIFDVAGSGAALDVGLILEEATVLLEAKGALDDLALLRSMLGR